MHRSTSNLPTTGWTCSIGAGEEESRLRNPLGGLWPREESGAWNPASCCWSPACPKPERWMGATWRPPTQPVPPPPQSPQYNQKIEVLLKNKLIQTVGIISIFNHIPEPNVIFAWKKKLNRKKTTHFQSHHMQIKCWRLCFPDILMVKTGDIKQHGKTFITKTPGPDRLNISFISESIKKNRTKISDITASRRNKKDPAHGFWLPQHFQMRASVSFSVRRWNGSCSDPLCCLDFRLSAAGSAKAVKWSEHVQ